MQGCNCFYDCAIFFTFSIQVACVVVLARLDFGVSATGMGAYTAEITWAISLLTILPPMYIAFSPHLFEYPTIKATSNPESQKTIDLRKQLKFLLFGLCWLLFIYPFLSRMMETFGPSMIGGDGEVISESDWGIIVQECSVPVGSLIARETTAMNVLSVAGSLFVCLLTITKIVWLAMDHARYVVSELLA